MIKDSDGAVEGCHETENSARRQMAALYAQEDLNKMSKSDTTTDAPERGVLALKAVTTVTTDEGVFEAVISTATVDSDKDIVEPSGMVRALKKWATTGKKIPLAWQHSTAAEDIIGNIDPATVKQVGREVVATGWIDQSIERGQHAWRLVKSGTLGFSFGYLIIDAAKRKGGGFHIKELDVFEVTATVIPSNRETRVLGWKSAEERDAVITELQEVKDRLTKAEKALEDLSRKADETDEGTKSRSVDPLRQQAEEVALDVASDGLSLRPPPKVKAPAPKREPQFELAELRERSRDLMLQVLSGNEEL